METQTKLTRGRPSQYSAEQITKALDMIREGSTLAAAAKETGMTSQVVAYYKRKNDVAGASVPGVLPTVVVDALGSFEMALVSKYDGEITRLQTTIERAQERLRETTTKRRRVARALGLMAEETPTGE